MPHSYDASRFGRRDLLKGAAAAGAAAGLGAFTGFPGSPAALEPARSPAPATSRACDGGLIRRENELPGTTDWQLTYVRQDTGNEFRTSLIEGYASRASVRPGESVALMVSTDPATPFVIDIYRSGWYGGAGGRHIVQLGPFEGRPQPVPEVGQDRLRECRWEPACELTIPGDWPSGVYLGKLTALHHRYQSYLIFIVRDDRPADIVFQCSDNTWQAYNLWPDNYSLYTNDRGDGRVLVPGVRVSYDRPYGKYCQIYDNPLSQGSGEWLLWEFPFAYWLESLGYDVTYVSNTDVHADPQCVRRGRLFLSVGHDEYWSREQFDHVRAAVEAGVHVGFFSGNTCCFVAPFSPSSDGTPNRVITRAGRYGGVSAEEEAYMGPFPETGPNEATLIGARTVSPFNGSGDWICTRPEHWLFEGTSMRAGDAIPGIVGWEFHGDPAELPGLEIVAEGDTINSGGASAHWTATIYPGPRGNWVFNASTIFWAQGLSAPPGHMPPWSHYGRPHGPDERVQRITRNFLERCSG